MAVDRGGPGRRFRSRLRCPCALHPSAAVIIMAGRCSCPSRPARARGSGGDAHTEYPVGVRDIFRTAMGKTIRVDETDDGALTVEVLRDGTWMRAPLGMIGLRLSPKTRRLTAREIDGLPA